MTADDQKLADDVRTAFREVTAAISRAQNAGLMVNFDHVKAQSVGEAGSIPLFNVQIGRPI
ncbi:hypothetical protein ACP4J4_10380 [Aureimonas ureilytica]|uniref:hypothetical protein n=1 Tax=Aureimonas ureilytica TaxID=401562 RepID=UPI003CF3FA22